MLEDRERGTLSAVPRVTRVSVPPPADVAIAARAFGSPVRLAVLHELAAGPRITGELMEALGVTDRSTMVENLRELETFDVIIGSPGPDSRSSRPTTWTANPHRIAVLTAALASYVQFHE